MGPEEVEPFIKSQLSELINSNLKDKGVVWHASYVRTLSKVQLVLMEQEEYSEELSGVAQELRESLIKSKYRTLKLTAYKVQHTNSMFTKASDHVQNNISHSHVDNLFNNATNSVTASFSRNYLRKIVKLWTS